MTTALEGAEGSASRHGRSLPPRKTRYPLYRSMGGPQGRSGQVRKISPTPGFDPRIVQPVVAVPTTLPGPQRSNKYYVFWVCVCNSRHPAHNAHAPYFHLWSARLYDIFPNYLIKGTIFGKESYWTKNVCFDFLYKMSETFLILRRTVRDKIKINIGLHTKYSFSLSDFNTLRTGDADLRF